MAIAADKHQIFAKLYQEFLTSYGLADIGKRHADYYAKARADARAGYELVLETAKRGEDYTDLALLKLLPYSDVAGNRERGAWCTFSPAINMHVKTWFENAPHIRMKPEGWPDLVRDLVGLIRRVVDDPHCLEVACVEFASKPHSRGFQTGMISPVLNALRPDKLLLVNQKPREVLSYLTGERVSLSLTDYAHTSAVGFAVIDELADVLDQAGPPGLSRADRFDMFCHWLVAVKKYPFRDVGYWKIAPGEHANKWERCRDEGFICIGWDELGDLTDLTNAEFEQRRTEVLKAHPDWTKTALRQVWRFSRIREGDRIVANKGWSEVVGIGTVTGPYYFVPGEEHGHRLPVDWDDTRRRRISKQGWSMTLAKLDQPDFDEVANAPPIEDDDGGSGGGTVPPPPPPPPPDGTQPPYALLQLASDTYQDLREVERWVRAVKRKGQMIFFGPPGTGKTFCAKRLARHLVERGNGFVETVQFHPSYGYEDFIEGIRPRTTDAGELSYSLVRGRFLAACDRAARLSGTSVLIIDEINRANLSRVFGELMFLLEYRNDEIPLASGTPFRMPTNLLLVGTMNTADRSIALIDHALRRRFAFVRLPPCVEALRRFHVEHETDFEPEGLIQVLERLNRTIEDPNYAVGVSFFMHEDAATCLGEIWEMEIEPYLEEYFFDRPARAEEFRWAKVAKEILPG